jgi:hypothetical protein
MPADVFASRMPAHVYVYTEYSLRRCDLTDTYLTDLTDLTDTILLTVL